MNKEKENLLIDILNENEIFNICDKHKKIIKDVNNKKPFIISKNQNKNQLNRYRLCMTSKYYCVFDILITKSDMQNYMDSKNNCDDIIQIIDNICDKEKQKDNTSIIIL